MIYCSFYKFWHFESQIEKGKQSTRGKPPCHDVKWHFLLVNSDFFFFLMPFSFHSHDYWWMNDLICAKFSLRVYSQVAHSYFFDIFSLLHPWVTLVVHMTFYEWNFTTISLEKATYLFVNEKCHVTQRRYSKNHQMWHEGVRRFKISQKSVTYYFNGSYLRRSLICRSVK